MIAPNTAPAVAETIPAALLKIPGLDTHQGLHVLNGQVAAYVRLLRRFAAVQAEDMPHLRESLSQGDRDRTRRLAHALKGSSGNLGVTSVQHLAAELETAIQDERNMAASERLIHALTSELQHLTAAVLAALPDVTASHVVEADWLLLQPLLEQLEPLLEASSTQANVFIEPHTSLLKAALGNLGAELEQQIEHFLYSEALVTLKHARVVYPRLTAQ